ncbi:glycosyltransferase family 2 protein [Hazenella sp. IB182353]|uniref:tetratricopeptide repeat-containing glycosyltransferase family 2 protein n=1 Tax=Polycladospora coralii TaxID=2771432 RepID=UPI0017464488|nr:glycosyltransferase family 2 protein [Polycladospora coralii]MBS7530921.1 glycosyltransferase family 2 protein [Polycladospora coralii]
MRKHIVVASLIHGESDCVREFLLSLMELEQNDLKVTFLFIDVSDCTEVRHLLQEFRKKEEHCHIYMYPDLSHPERQLEKLINHTLQYDCEGALFLVSDILMHPLTLTHLLSTNQEIVASIVWKEREGIKQPNIEASTVGKVPPLKRKGIYEVNTVADCIFVKRSVLDQGILFTTENQTIVYSSTANQVDLPVFVDTNYPCYALKTKQDLQGVLEYKNDCRADMVQDPEEITISLCMIVRDEERTLERCLSSIEDIVDEIIIVDTGSTDKTIEIAKKFTDRIYTYQWIDDFADARNFSFQFATKEYILWLDADDYLTEENVEKFKRLKYSLNRSYDAVSMIYRLDNDAFTFRKHRLIRRSPHLRWKGFVHEYLEVHGNYLHSEIEVQHKKAKEITDRNLQIYNKYLKEGRQFTAPDYYHYAKELRQHQLYEEAIYYFQKYLNTNQGWKDGNIYACIRISECYQLMFEFERALEFAFQTFAYGLPEPEACCRIGNIFIRDRIFPRAAFWFERVTKMDLNHILDSYTEQSIWNWYPHLKLFTCYASMNEMDKAQYHITTAYTKNPTNPVILKNLETFKRVVLQV